jgi:hypothetical protein
MDVRAFGSIYGQMASLPYTSGFKWIPSDGRVNFPSCRALFIQNGGGSNKTLALEFSDAPGQVCQNDHLNGDFICPISATALISGNVTNVMVLY